MRQALLSAAAPVLRSLGLGSDLGAVTGGGGAGPVAAGAGRPRGRAARRRARRRARNVLEALEGRQYLAAETLPGSAGTDDYDVRLSEDATQIRATYTLSGAAPVTVSFPVATTTSLTISAGDGDDTLVLNVLRHSPFVNDLVAFDGGAGTDRIELAGSTDFRRRLTVRHWAEAGSGAIEAVQRRATYSSVEAIDVRTVSLLTVATPGTGADELSITAPSATQNRLAGTSGGLALTPVTFTDALTVAADASAGTGDDALEVSTDGIVAANLALLRLQVGAGTGNALTAQGGTVPFEAVGPAGSTAPALAGVTVAAGATLEVAGTQHYGSLFIAEGSRVALTSAGDALLQVGSLSIAGGGGTSGKLYPGQNHLMIGTADVLSVRAMIMTGKIAGELADTDSLYTLGYAAADDPALGQAVAPFAGRTYVPATTVLVRHTRRGDANLDGDVDLLDVMVYGPNWTGEKGLGVGTLAPVKLWTQGDWDHDGDVDVLDVLKWGPNSTGELGGVMRWPYVAGSISGPAVSRGPQYTLSLSSEGLPVGEAVAAWLLIWGDGTVERIEGDPASATHVYDDLSTYTVTAFVVTADKSYYAGSLPVRTSWVSVEGAPSVVAGGTYTVTPAFEEGLDAVTCASWAIDWGDGSPPLEGDDAMAPRSHPYDASASRRTITVTAVDTLGRTHSTEQPVRIVPGLLGDAVAATVPGTGGDDRYYARYDAAEGLVRLWANAGPGAPPADAPAYSFDPLALASLRLEGGAGNDALALDASAGELFRAGVLTFDGGPGTADALALTGDSVLDLAYDPGGTTTGSGRLSIGGRDLAFAGVESLSADAFPSVSVTTPNAADAVSLAEAPPVGGRAAAYLSVASGGVQGAPITFAGAARLTLDAGLHDAAGGSADSVAVNTGWGELGLGQLALALRRGAGADALVVNGACSLGLDLGSRAQSQGLAVSVAEYAAVTLATPADLSSLSVADDATLTVADGAFKLVTTAALSVSPTGTLYLEDNTLVVRGGSLTALAGLLRSGFGTSASTRWLGPGIASGPAAGQAGKAALGVARAEDLPSMQVQGYTLAAGDVVVRYTYDGDADLDGTVTAADADALAAGLAGQGSGWRWGDFNHSGTITNAGDTYATNDQTAFNLGQAQSNADGTIPAFSVSGEASLDEGWEHELTLTHSTGSGEQAITEWTVDWGDGTLTTHDADPSGTTYASHLYPDAGAYAIGAYAAGPLQSYFGGQTSVTVNDVMPTLTLSGSGDVGENGDDKGLSLGLRWGDRAPGDIESWSVDWGDGTTSSGRIVVDDIFGNVHLAHDYAAAGTFQVTATVADDDGNVATATTPVTVHNAAPAMGALAGKTAEEGASVYLELPFTDDAFDRHTATVDWGDGTVEPAWLYQSHDSGTLAGAHVYADNGTYTVTFRAIDALGAASTRAATVTVTNVAPDVDRGWFSRTLAGQPVTVTAYFFDPGTADTHAYAWTLRDVLGNVLGTGTNADFAFTPAALGRYTLSVTVTDDDGGYDAATYTFLAVATLDDGPAPAAPTTLATSVVSADGVTLTWQDNSSGEDGFVIEWSPDGVEFYAIDTVDPDVTTYTDEYPLLNYDNHYRVNSYFGSADSTPTETVTAKPITEPLGFYDDNDGYNGRNTLTQVAIRHDSGPVDFSVYPNDLDIASLPFWVEDFTQPAHGTLDLLDAGNGFFRYTPAEGFVGTDTFLYWLTDGTRVSAEVTAAVDVTNARPAGMSRRFFDLCVRRFQWNSEPVNSTGEQYLWGEDADGDDLTYRLVDYPQHGTVDIEEASGRFTYGPDDSYHGFDSFTYVVNDGVEDSVPCKIVIEDPPLTPWFNIGVPAVAGQDNFHEGFIDSQFDIVSPPPPTMGTAWMSDWCLFFTPDPSFTRREAAFGMNYKAGRFTSPLCNAYFEVNAPGDDDWSWCRGTFPVNSLFYVSPSRVTTFGPEQSGFLIHADPEDRIGVARAVQAEHGTVEVNKYGGFSYAPNDPDYRGWDKFGIVYTNATKNTAINWIVVHITENPPETSEPGVSGVPADWAPAAFEASRDGVLKAYETAKAELGKVFAALERLGEADKAYADALGYPTELDEVEGIAALDAATTAFDRYYQQLMAAIRLAGEFKGSFAWYNYFWQKDYEAVEKVNTLPLDVAGLDPSRDLLKKLNEALAADAAGSDALVKSTTYAVQLAKDVHNALQAAIAVGGISAAAIGGAQLLTQQGCRVFAQAVARQVAYTAAAAGISVLASPLLKDLARALGLNEDHVRIGADAIQLFCLIKAARAARAAREPGCFVAGTEVHTANGPVPIEQVRVGQRVLTETQATGPGAPPAVLGDPFSTQVDPETWRLVSLRMPSSERPGDYHEIQLLEPLLWVQRFRADAGAWIDLSLPELGIGGDAEVLSVGPCPPIESGYGRVVLGTFTSVSHDVYELRLVGEDEPIGVTGGHPIWSLGRGDWAQAAILQPGEHLATQSGEALVESVSRLAGERRVYNLSVEVDHRYLVGTSALLAHNVDPACRSLSSILADEKLFMRWLKRGHPLNQPLNTADARSVWNKLVSMGLNPRHDPTGVTGIWTGPHINVQAGGMNVHIPVDPGFVP